MNTLFVGRKVIKLESVDSTNRYTLDLIQDSDLIEGSVIYTTNQTSGKGQRGNVWISEAHKNLTFSLVLKPSFLAIEDQFNLTKVISIAVCDFLGNYTQEKINIKWPNDILLNNRKIGGILIENILRSDKINYSIVGIGLNINQTVFNLGTTNYINSMKLATGFDFEIEKCFDELCETIERRYLQLKSGNNKIHREYLDRLFQIGEWCNYKVGANVLLGKITGIHKTGRLLFENREGEQHEFALKEIEFIL